MAKWVFKAQSSYTLSLFHIATLAFRKDSPVFNSNSHVVNISFYSQEQWGDYLTKYFEYFINLISKRQSLLFEYAFI